MARVKRGVTTHARHKKVLERAKGYRGRAGTSFRVAIEKVEKGLQYAYRDRRNEEAHVPRPVDPADQRRGARARHSPTRGSWTASPRPASRSTARSWPISRSRSPTSFKALVDQAQAARAERRRRQA